VPDDTTQSLVKACLSAFARSAPSAEDDETYA
jgi:hypothetical protein